METEKLKVEKEKLELEKQKLAFEIQLLVRRASYTIENDIVLPFLAVIHLLRERTLGNSPTRLVAKQLKENHGEEWLHHLAHYMEECAVFADRPSFLPVAFQEPPEPIEVPTSKWLLTVYGKDIISRLDHIKITKKLAGHAWGTVQWLFSVANKRGQILTSVLTVQEGPEKGQSKLQTRFGGWPNLNIRLDIWHFVATGYRAPPPPSAHQNYKTTIFICKEFTLHLIICLLTISSLWPYFLTGTSTNTLNIQLYLLEGLNRWNQDRAAASLATKPSSLVTYAGEVVHQSEQTNSLKVFWRKYIPSGPLRSTLGSLSEWTTYSLRLDSRFRGWTQMLRQQTSCWRKLMWLRGFEEDLTDDPTLTSLLEDLTTTAARIHPATSSALPADAASSALSATSSTDMSTIPPGISAPDFPTQVTEENLICKYLSIRKLTE
ncbi:uncharacterized protein LOC128318157 [Pangasianodon hypophthalmus]|uniref:uncharacterized protein LOC128318157 n=1 Tax=Pangasianodon hypophthalmus TaxID=310915 RepID=UPI0023078568|nr:uncharacterized protein LOC128318157 [Pangasianodon hypophthalmus]